MLLKALQRYVAFPSEIMIIEADIINLPYSGEFVERIYDVPNPWNSPNWTYAKFTNEDYSEWCGHFRGSPINIAISEPLNCVLVLTSDYLFCLDRQTGNIIDLEDQPQYRNLTVTPLGDFIVADYYHLFRIKENIKDKVAIESPVSMDMIQFKGWSGKKLNFTCDEFMNWDRHWEMELDCDTFEIMVKNAT